MSAASLAERLERAGPCIGLPADNRIISAEEARQIAALLRAAEEIVAAARRQGCAISNTHEVVGGHCDCGDCAIMRGLAAWREAEKKCQ